MWLRLARAVAFVHSVRQDVLQGRSRRTHSHEFWPFKTSSGATPRMSRISTRLWIPVIGSFAVYVVPLVGPHAIGSSASHWPREWRMLTGPILVAGRECGLRVCSADRDGLLLAWTTRGSRLRLLTWCDGSGARRGMNVAYLVKIPSYFLIEPDTAPERADWTNCFVADAALMSIRASVTQPAAGVREWWMSRPDARHALCVSPSAP